MRELFKNRLGEFNEIAKQEIVDNQEINDDEIGRASCRERV